MRTGTWLGVLIAANSLLPGAGHAAGSVDVEFLPPTIQAQDICKEPRPDEIIVEEWRKWDLVQLPQQDPEIVIREARRLRDMNAAENLEIVDKILELLPTIDPNQKLQDTIVERVNLYVAANRLEELKRLGLIEKLLQSGDPLTPRTQNSLAELYLAGKVMPLDTARGHALLVSAALGGNADAILRLVELNLRGEKIEGWTVKPELAVLMAFGTLVGKLDSFICDRIERIAREFSGGRIVTKNYAIAERWLRLAADLGDGKAAWSVAALHLQSEHIEKENAVLLKYLQAASDDGIPQAEVELGSLLETGALIAPDLAKAQGLFQDAADKGSRSGLVRLALSMDSSFPGSSSEDHLEAVLRQLAALPDPPGWTFSKLAKVVLDKKGRWAGRSEASEILERGAALKDPVSQRMLAAILLEDPGQPGNFERAVDLLNLAVAAEGDTGAVADLHAALACHAPRDSQVHLASLRDESNGGSWSALTDDEIARLDKEKEPLLVAALQTAAIEGRPGAAAKYMNYLLRRGATEEEVAFWQARIAHDLPARTAVARLLYGHAQDIEGANRAIETLSEIADEGWLEAGIDMAEITLANFPDDQRLMAAASKYVQRAARAGLGKALPLIARTKPGETTSDAEVYAEFADVIEARGDGHALLFAARQTEDADRKRQYIDRARGILPCDFNTAMDMATAYAGLSDHGSADHWLDLSENLAAGRAWRYVAAGDRRLALRGEANLPKAIELYEQALDAGYAIGGTRLLKIFSNPKTSTYSPERAAATFKKLIATAPIAEVSGWLERVARSPAAIRKIVLNDPAVSDVYRKAAEAGDPIAMRELAKLTRTKDSSRAAAKEAADLFKKAAELGDSQSMVELAKAYALGIGIEQSFAHAREWLRQAAAKGNNEAQGLLATMSNEASSEQ
jgi:TPR repeat protein